MTSSDSRPSQATLEPLDEAPSLTMTFSFVPETGLYFGKLENGARFAISPNNVSGKLGANLDLLRQFTMRNRAGEAPNPHATAAKRGDEALVEEAIAAGKLQKVGVTGKLKLTLEDIGL